MKRKIILFISLLIILITANIFFLTNTYSYAQEASTSDGTYLNSVLEDEKNAAENLNSLKLPSLFEIAIRFLLALLVIIVIILVVALIYKQFFNLPLAGNDTKIIKLLEHRYIDAKKSIYLVELAGKYFLLSATPENLSLISEINGADSIEYINKMVEMKNPGHKDKDFKKILLGLSSSQKIEAETGKEQELENKGAKSGINFIKDKVQQIKRMINES